MNINILYGNLEINSQSKLNNISNLDECWQNYLLKYYNNEIFEDNYILTKENIFNYEYKTNNKNEILNNNNVNNLKEYSSETNNSVIKIQMIIMSIKKMHITII